MGSNYRIIPVGGGGGTTPTGTLDVSQNGTYDVRGYQYVNVDSSNVDYLCFEKEQNEVSTNIYMYASDDGIFNLNIEYSFDKETWTAWDGNNIALSDQSNKVYFRGHNSTICTITKFYTFSSSAGIFAPIHVSGCIETLLDYKTKVTTLPSYCYYRFFSNFSLTSAPYSIATEAGQYAYREMFSQCTKLTSIPQFPKIMARGVNMECPFESMYQGCYSLSGTLDLSYMTEAYRLTCEYGSIFDGTSYTHINLSNLTCVPFFGLKRTFMNMPLLESIDMSNCTTFDVKGPSDFYDNNCEDMLKNCYQLKEIKIGTKTASPTSFFNWVLNAGDGTGDFYNLNNYADFIPNSPSGIPTGWTIHNSL